MRGKSLVVIVVFMLSLTAVRMAWATHVKDLQGNPIPNRPFGSGGPWANGSDGAVEVDLTVGGFNMTGFGHAQFGPILHDNNNNEDGKTAIAGIHYVVTNTNSGGAIPPFEVKATGSLTNIIGDPEGDLTVVNVEAKDREGQILLTADEIPMHGTFDVEDTGQSNSHQRPVIFPPPANFQITQVVTLQPGSIPLTRHTVRGTPEPSTIVLVGVGLAGLAVAARRRRKQ